MKGLGRGKKAFPTQHRWSVLKNATVPDRESLHNEYTYTQTYTFTHTRNKSRTPSVRLAMLSVFLPFNDNWISFRLFDATYLHV